MQTAFLTYSQVDTTGSNTTIAVPDSSNGYSGPVINAPVNNGNTDVSKDVISENPTGDEINSLFQLATNGERDPFRIVALVASKKDKSLPGLEEFLFKNTNVKNTDNRDTTVKKDANKQYAIYALDAINSAASEELLMKVVSSHPDINIIGLSLKKLACDFYYRIKNNNMPGSGNNINPDKEIVHIMLDNADDTTYVQSCNEPIGKIAREGINNWTGQDYGDLPDSQQNKMSPNSMNGVSSNIKDYREQWWQNNNGNLSWNKDSGHFEVKH
jgi:hypothetical protein